MSAMASKSVFTSLPWEEIEGVELHTMYDEVLKLSEQPASPALSKFAVQAEVVFILLSNVLECALPTKITETDTFVFVEQSLADGQNVAPASATTWKSDGCASLESDASRKQQLLQSCMAWKAMKETCKDPSQLTPDNIKHFHKLLMSNALNERGEFTKAGDYRTKGCHSGTGYQYLAHEQIPQSVEIVLTKMKAAVQHDKKQLLPALVRLFYDLLIIHPFEDGNGRLCRFLLGALLVGYKLAPFPVPLGSQYRRSRRHCEQCLRYADQKHTGRLNSLLLVAIWSKWRNFQKLQELVSDS
eukprot:m.25515 g.25515  ORF g.25515 m.25515 type:complete len:300 (+) comp8729_c0_seq2:302-1201(+)